MKRLALGLVLISAGVAVAQQPATPSKTANAKATQDSVGAGKDTQSQTKVKTVSATMVSAKVVTPIQETTKEAAAKAAKKQAAKPPTPLHQHPTMVTMLQQNNGIRARVGLRGHRLNPALCRAAQNHAEYMASTGSFSHDTNGGYVYRARRFGFRGNVRENIGWNYATIDSAFAGWQSSGAHYGAIVSAETSDAGFGYAKSPSGQTYWVSVYGAATTADTMDVKTVQKKDLLAKEEADKARAAKEQAELAASEEDVDSQVVPASAEKPLEKQVEDTTPAKSKVGG